MRTKSFKEILTDVAHEWKWIFMHTRRYWWGVTLYILIGIVATLMGLGASIASKHLIDAVVNHLGAEIIVNALFVIGLAVSQVVFNAVSSIAVSKIGTRVNMELRSEFFEHITSSDWEQIKSYHSGDLINRLEGDVYLVSTAVINFLPTLITRITQFVGSAIIVFYYDKTMALLALIGAPFIFLTTKYMMQKIRVYNQQTRDTNGKIISFGEETLQNLQMVKAFGLSEKYATNFKALLLQYRKVKTEYDKFTILTTMGVSLIGLIVSYSCYGWGVWRLWQGAITFGTMTLFLQLSGNLTNTFSALVSMAPSIVSIATSAGRLMEITQLEQECDEYSEEAQKLYYKANNGKIEIVAENLSFTYKDSDEAVLKNANFRIKSGETVAVVGPSGEGKTTFLRLILGMIRPTDGSIIFSSDEDLLYASMSTRRLCSYVPQVNSILYGTVAENLRTVSADATDEDLIEVLNTADAWDFVSAMPEGINAKIGERNINLSEGQAQRLSIARALLRNAPVLLMDEATSSLDAETEEKVLKNIMKLNPNRICILTTHRPSMLKYCSRIYRINEDGSFEVYDNTIKE